jgi:hypothetical protein
MREKQPMKETVVTSGFSEEAARALPIRASWVGIL